MKWQLNPCAIATKTMARGLCGWSEWMKTDKTN